MKKKVNSTLHMTENSEIFCDIFNFLLQRSHNKPQWFISFPFINSMWKIHCGKYRLFLREINVCGGSRSIFGMLLLNFSRMFSKFTFTVWKFHDFSISQLLRKIKSILGMLKMQKSSILIHWDALNLDFYEFLHFSEGWNLPN